MQASLLTATRVNIESCTCNTVTFPTVPCFKSAASFSRSTCGSRREEVWAAMSTGTIQMKIVLCIRLGVVFQSYLAGWRRFHD